MAAHVAAPEGCRVLAAWGEGSCRDGQAPGGQVSLGAGQRQVLVKAAIEDLPTPRACFKAPQVVLGLWPKRFYHPGSCSLPFKPLFDPFVSFVFFQSYWGHGLYLMVAVVKLFNCNVKVFCFIFSRAISLLQRKGLYMYMSCCVTHRIRKIWVKNKKDCPFKNCSMLNKCGEDIPTYMSWWLLSRK